MPTISIIEAQSQLTLTDAKTFPQALKEFANNMAAVIAKEATAEGKLATLIAAKAVELAQRPTHYWRNRVVFTADVSQERIEEGRIAIRVTLRVTGPGEKYYQFANSGTRPHVIRPKNKKALLLRAYRPKTRPITISPSGELPPGEGLMQYRRTSIMIGSRWTGVRTEPAKGLRGYKGKYYSAAWLRSKATPGRRYFQFAKRVTQHVNPRYFSVLIEEALNNIIPREMAKFGKELKGVLGDKVRYKCHISGG